MELLNSLKETSYMNMINMSKMAEHEKAFANLSGDARVLYHKILNLSYDLENEVFRAGFL